MSETATNTYLGKTVPCIFCGKSELLEVPADKYDEWRNTGKPIQEVFADYSVGFRELLMTGIHVECMDF